MRWSPYSESLWKATGIYRTYSISGKTAAFVPKFAVEGQPSAELQPRFLCLYWMTCPWAEYSDDSESQWIVRMPVDHACGAITGAMKRNGWLRVNGEMKFVIGENGRRPEKKLPRPLFVHHEAHLEWQRHEPGILAVGGLRYGAG